MIWPPNPKESKYFINPMKIENDPIYKAEVEI